ncbi:MAG: ribosome small subunit-dependent GTPase A [Chloroflexi bacterium]|nr:ribosome small subunit-dependent GTPase A [Chloroflexota bacterium]
MLRGLIVRLQSGFYTVDTDAGPVVCRLRGRLKQGRRAGDILAVGDWVQITLLEDDTGMIEEIEERHSMLSRMAPTPRGEYQQILIANPDRAVFVFACADPEPHLRMLDRLLIVAEKAKIPSLIVFNKVDLIGWWYARRWYGHYKNIGYSMLFTSATTGRGVAALRSCLAGKISVLAGPSGAGKSSLLNAVQPELGLAVRDVSKLTGKGRHTTAVRAMFPLEGGGYVADTPGLKAMALWDIEPEEVDGYFPELRDLVADCKFSNCMHLHEPGCAVKAAVEKGRVHEERYESYIRMRYEEGSEEEEW